MVNKFPLATSSQNTVEVALLMDGTILIFVFEHRFENILIRPVCTFRYDSLLQREKREKRERHAIYGTQETIVLSGVSTETSKHILEVGEHILEQIEIRKWMPYS